MSTARPDEVPASNPPDEDLPLDDLPLDASDIDVAGGGVPGWAHPGRAPRSREHVHWSGHVAPKSRTGGLVRVALERAAAAKKPPAVAGVILVTSWLELDPDRPGEYRRATDAREGATLRLEAKLNTGFVREGEHVEFDLFQQSRANGDVRLVRLESSSHDGTAVSDWTCAWRPEAFAPGEEPHVYFRVRVMDDQIRSTLLSPPI